MRSRRLIALVALLAAAALGLAACGGGDGEEGALGTTDFFDTGIFEGVDTELPPPPAAEEPPPPPAADDPTIIQLTVPPPGQPIGPQSPSERIAEVQRALLALGFQIGQADGIYGQKTRNAIRRFQRNQDLQVDGLVGPQTARAMNRELRRRAAG